MWFWLLLVWGLFRLFKPSAARQVRRRPGPPIAKMDKGAACPKPAWVRREVLSLDDALNGNPCFGRRRRAGCRTLALHFNRLHAARGVRVGKSFVAQVLADQRLRALHVQHDLKHRIPADMPGNVVWAMDSTLLRVDGQTSSILLGIIDHGSRLITGWRRVRCFNAWTALGVLCLAIGQWGKPVHLRTDNAAVFHSRLWRTGLRLLLGIRRQFTQPGCPWQNGRIERCFGTFKACWAELALPLRIDLDMRLAEFRHWYNTMRPHQHLHGRTPMETWHLQTRPAPWVPHQWWGGALRTVLPLT
jgi:putative transposase